MSPSRTYARVPGAAGAGLGSTGGSAGIAVRRQRADEDEPHRERHDDAEGARADPPVALLALATTDQPLEGVVGRRESLHHAPQPLSLVHHRPSPSFSRIAARARVARVRTVLARMPSIRPASSDERPT